MNDVVAFTYSVDRRRTAAVPDQIGITIIFNDRDVIPLGDVQQLPAPFYAHDGAGRILHGRDRIDIFWPDAALFEIGQRILQHVHAEAFAVEWNSHRRDVEAVEARQRSAIGLLLGDDRISRLQQDPVDQIEGLERARGQQYVLG